MRSRYYAAVLTEYVQRFRDRPPSILTDNAAKKLMEEAIRRGTPITEVDLAPAGSPPSLYRRDAA